MHNADPAAEPHELQPGDLCHHGSNALPLYRVIWVDEGRAWLRDVNNGQDSVVELERCRACADDDDLTDGCTPEPPTTPTPVTWPDGTPRP
jgi:hypothetical protein